MTLLVDRPTTSPATQEVAPTLTGPVPRPLGLLDVVGLWGNLGVSLLGVTGAIYVLTPVDGAPPLSLAAALTATVLGTVLGTLALAGVAVLGTRTGAPAMVLLRGLLGARLSGLPTVLNVAQCLGWGTFELVTIAGAAHTVLPGTPRWVLVVVAGALTTALALRPLGSVRLLRRYVTLLVVADLGYLVVVLLTRHPLHETGGGWGGFWIAVDTLVALSVSFVPLAADYTRHVRSPRATFIGTFVGYGLAQVACYALGLVTLLTLGTGADVYGAFVAVPLGTLAFALLAVRELDQSFVNVYSTAVSLQNLRPHWDRRVLALVLGAIATALALVVGIRGYENFLVLLGAVFVPLTAVLLVDFACRRGAYDLSIGSPARWSSLLPWGLGFTAYELVNPGYLSGWAPAWQRVDSALHLSVPGWLSASLLSFGVAALVTALLALPRAAARRRAARPAAG